MTKRQKKILLITIPTYLVICYLAGGFISVGIGIVLIGACAAYVKYK